MGKEYTLPVDTGAMAAIVTDMDDFAIHVGALERHFPSDLPVLVVGHHPRKTGWVRNAFVTFNFSFITRGEGEYRTAERTYPVIAPCMITQWPGVSRLMWPTQILG